MAIYQYVSPLFVLTLIRFGTWINPACVVENLKNDIKITRCFSKFSVRQGPTSDLEILPESPQPFRSQVHGKLGRIHSKTKSPFWNGVWHPSEASEDQLSEVSVLRSCTWVCLKIRYFLGIPKWLVSLLSNVGAYVGPRWALRVCVGAIVSLIIQAKYPICHQIC